jgi:hypothetical protein
VTAAVATRIGRQAWLLGCCAAIMLAAIVFTGVRLAMGDDGAPACRSALIPAYLTADDLGRIAERPVPGRVVILNPSSGPGAAAQPAYRRAVEDVQRSGTTVLGYVHTTYGARPLAEVRADIERYRSWYRVDGIFLDEAAATAAELPYYRSVRDAARAEGEPLLALNPGVVPARGYFDIADIVVTFEGDYTDYAAAVRRTPDWVRAVPPGKIAHLVYGATRAQARAVVDEDPSARYVYATSGVLPDPWSALPDYLDEEESQLAACGTST